MRRREPQPAGAVQMHQRRPLPCLGVADAKPVGLDKTLAERSARRRSIARLCHAAAPFVPARFYHAFSAGISSRAKSRIERRTLALSCPG